MERLKPLVVAIVLGAALSAGCSGAAGDSDAANAGGVEQQRAVRVSSIRAPSPWIAGTHVAASFDLPLAIDDSTRLLVSVGGVSRALAPNPNRSGFVVSTDDIAAWGDFDGLAKVDLDADVPSGPTSHEVSVRRVLPLTIEAVLWRQMYHNGVLSFVGDGFLAPSEGRCEVLWEGRSGPAGPGLFSSGLDEERAVATEGESELLLVDPHDRTRASSFLPLGAAGLDAEFYDGTVGVRCVPRDGAAVTRTGPPARFPIERPVVFGLDAERYWVGQLVGLRGGGFLLEAATTAQVRLTGVFTPNGGNAIDIGPVDLFVEPESGEFAQFPLLAIERDKRLVAELFGFSHGRFEGTVQLVTGDGTRTLEGGLDPVAFDLLGVRQVVEVVFLPGFRTSLSYFGLQAGAALIEQRVIERIGELYQGYAVEVVAELDDSIDTNHAARIEIGGADPNGIGLFGFDNTAGKDVGNLRLFDVIGGANADTQQDGYPGYGGVFVESMIWWSSQPPSALPVPAARPEPDPLFDEIFGPVRARPIRLAEVAGEGDSDRLRVVNRAMRAFVYVVAETAAHELGHSLGLAEPYGAANVFHRSEDGPGCLMDRGDERPFGERAGEPGFEPTRFCGDEPAYLSEILGR